MGRIDGFSAQARIALSTAALTASSVVVALMGVLAVHLSAQDLGHIGYGEFVTVTSIVGMVTLIADLGITSVTARDVAKERHRAAEIIGEALTFRLTMCAVIAPIVVVGAYFVYPHQRGTVVLGIGVLVFDLFCNAILTVSSAYFSAGVRNDITAVIVVVGKTLYLGGTVVAVAFGLPLVAFLVAYLAGDALMAAIGFVMVRRRIGVRLSFHPDSWWQMAVVAVPVGTVQVVTRLMSRLDSFLLSILRGPVEVGFDGIGQNFTDVLAIFPAYLMSAVLPSLVNASTSEELQDKIQAAFEFVIWLAVPLAIGGFTLRRVIVSIIAGPGYEAAATPLALLVLTVVVSFPQVVFGWGCLATDNFGRLMPVVFASLAVNVALNLLFIPGHGAEGAAASQIATQALSSTMTFWVFRRASGLVIRVGGVWRSLVCGAFLAVIAWATRSAWEGISPFLAGPVGVVGLGIAYIGLSLLLGAIPAELRDLTKRLVVSVTSSLAPGRVLVRQSHPDLGSMSDLREGVLPAAFIEAQPMGGRDGAAESRPPDRVRSPTSGRGSRSSGVGHQDRMVERGAAGRVAVGGPIVVTGAGGGAGVAAIQALQGAGHTVVAVDADEAAVGFRLADDFSLVPRADHPAFAERLAKLGRAVAPWH